MGAQLGNCPQQAASERPPTEHTLGSTQFWLPGFTLSFINLESSSTKAQQNAPRWAASRKGDWVGCVGANLQSQLSGAWIWRPGGIQGQLGPQNEFTASLSYKGKSYLEKLGPKNHILHILVIDGHPLQTQAFLIKANNAIHLCEWANI